MASLHNRLKAAALSRPWTEADGEKLKDLWVSGVPVGRIARYMNRRPDFIKEKLKSYDCETEDAEDGNYRIMRYDRKADIEIQVGWSNTWDQGREECRKLNSVAPRYILYWSEPKSWDGIDVFSSLLPEDDDDVGTTTPCDTSDDDDD